MNTFWRFLLVVACLLIGCAQPKPPTDVPITTKSDEARALYVQARDKVENQELDKALPLLDRAIQLDNEFAMAYALKGQASSEAAARRENMEKAKALIGKVSPGERWMISYMDASQTGQWKLYLDSLLAQYPGDKRIHFYKGVYYRTIGDFKNAVAQYEAAVKIDSTFAPPYNLLGYDQMNLGNPLEAEKAFKSYIRLLPSAPNPVDSYAEFLLMTGRYDESIGQYEKVLTMDPSFISSMVGIGNCYVRKGDVQKAREYYQGYIDKSPRIDEKIAGYYSLAASFVQEGKIPEALKVLEQGKALALSQKENSRAIWLAVSQSFVTSVLGDPSQGLKKCNEAIQLTKDLTLTDRARETFQTRANSWLAYAYAETNDLAKAKESAALLAKDLERRNNPGEGNELTAVRGYLDIKEGRYDEGIQKLSGVPEGPFTLYAMALAYAKKGEKDNAAKMTDKLAKWTETSLDRAITLRKIQTLRVK